MNSSHADTDEPDKDQKGMPTSSATTSDNAKQGMSLSMHDGIAVWCDCCSCEAEPYWAALAEELGVDLSDYE